MKILLLGKNGQVGWELQRALAPLGELIVVGKEQLDLTDLSALRQLILDTAPQWIVNAAAYTAVDKAESENQLAYIINAQAVEVIAECAKSLDAWFVHYSTDYVFDGSKIGAYVESDKTNPLSVYGQSKLAGEQAIVNSGCLYLIFRTSWVFSVHGHNFIKSILKLAQTRQELNIVADQFGSPTSAELIADVTALCLKHLVELKSPQAVTKCGVYHLVAAGEVSWYLYAQYIIEQCLLLGKSQSVTKERVKPIPSEAYELPATRPKNSILSTTKLTEAFNLTMPHWSVHVDQTLADIIRE